MTVYKFWMKLASYTTENQAGEYLSLPPSIGQRYYVIGSINSVLFVLSYGAISFIFSYETRSN
jgi:hypothetical protein